MTLIDLPTANVVQEFMGAPRFVSGGSVANTTAGIAVLGGTAGFVGAVADDEVGRTYTENLRAAGVEFEPHLSESAAADGLGTGRCVVLITEDADRTMGTYLGAASTLSPEGVPTSFVARASIVLLEGYLWDVPAAKEAMRHAAATAHARGGLGGALPVGPVLRRPPPARVPRPPDRRRGHPSRERGGGHHALRGQLVPGRPRGRGGDRAAGRHDPGRAGRHRPDGPGARGGSGRPRGPGGRHDRRRGPLRRGAPLRPDPRHGPRREHPPGRAVRGRGHLAHRRPARGRPQDAWPPTPASSRASRPPREPFDRHRRAAQCGQVHALQRAHQQRGAGGELPLRHH